MSAGEFGFQDRLTGLRTAIDERLGRLLPTAETHPERLHSAMRYSLLAPGKRIRPILAVSVATHFGVDQERVLDPACAIEMVHTASLIFDDLPSMDAATLRRGKPANHKVYGEDTATLAAVALMNRGYGVLAEAMGLDSAVRVELIALLCKAIGSDGVIAGQENDLHADRGGLDVVRLVRMHGQKTGALFVASAEIGARLAGLKGAELESIRGFSRNLGVAFQIHDDLLDLEGSRSSTGKDVGQDVNKITALSLMDPEHAGKMAGEFRDEAVRAVGSDAGPLIELVDWLLDTRQPPVEPAFRAAQHR
jgi:geranylgeranyl diphosphate synthase type II